MTPELRAYIWPILFGVIPFTKGQTMINDRITKLQKQYINIRKQCELLTHIQYASSRTLTEAHRIIENDVKRNDRQMDAFKDDDSPNLELLRHVLQSYSIFNRDVCYVQGMNDIVSSLILVFIDKNENSEFLFYGNPIKKTMIESESLIFWNFVGLMKLTQQERVFTDLAENQKFVLQRTAAIATAFHPPMKKLLESSELSELSFLLRPFLLLFKRAFKENSLFRLWDAVFTSDSPNCFLRFVGAAILIIIFPKLLIHTNQTLGEVMSFADGFMETVSIETVLCLASLLVEKLERPHPLHDYVYEPIPPKDKLKEYVPKYVNLN
ncbi:TBC domain containing protein [Histomonas meleagridis]|uniref:TBC domain containing protein n=1 Tax=Histomonas meleagridis TaxID=135588 RepID=UPI0035596F67|nr:TBC domain containing protein [Histomonas meleagridis]KAH0799245.1 TBC domain containing protein [Histomonas meleagridis]